MALKMAPWLGLLSLLFFQTSCKRSKLQKSIAEIPKTEKGAADSLKVSEIISDFEIVETDFDYLKLKSKIDLKSPNISQSFPANVHIKKDSIIWVSVSVGIEAARCIITPDSIQMLDRINKKYYALSIAELNRQFDFDFDFRLLQSVLIGNLPITRSDKDKLVRNSLYVSLFQEAREIDIENQIDNVSHKLTTILAEDTEGKSKLGISYSDFEELDSGQLVPFSIFAKIDVLQKGGLHTTTLDFKHTKFEFVDNTLRFPYSIPKSYQKGEIVF
ncbi:DUF4292 domain-containing protein [Marinilongibacter aquaticus]|uniref:DUF4292 domain-containing protein n=1 Tax=Marinilongibacter aquaticus TaxID=2975157 RepID=UPI0021BD275E|nr:DUF4292 domain-containing protein [Marinilongibacter aquaticus]UBM57728.1 DUF4292 domain-containing protein [Marinilongibacter aquaticus]